MMLHWSLFVALSAAPSLTTATQDSIQGRPQTVGTATLSFQVDQIDPQARRATLDIDAELRLPPGNGFIFLPIPAPHSAEFHLAISPVSTDNDILTGSLRPENDITIIAVALAEDTSNVRFSIQNVVVPLQERSHQSPEVSLSLMVDRAYQRFLDRYPEAPVPRLDQLVFQSDLFQRSSPEATISHDGTSRVIALPEDRFWLTRVVVSLKIPERRTPLYIFLVVLGLLIGVVGSVGRVATKRQATIGSIVAVLSLVAGAFTVFFVLTPSQRTEDSTVIVTLGTAAGIFLGIFAASVWRLIKG